VTDVTTDQDQGGAGLPAADEQLLRELTERARAGGLRLTGAGGLLGKLTKMVAGGALEASWMIISVMRRMTRPAVTAGIRANGHRAKTVLTEAGPVELSVVPQAHPAVDLLGGWLR